MALPDYSIDEKLLQCAKKEFLEKGYEKAALRTICKNAEITTGALYKRYTGKEDLLMAILLPYVERIRSKWENQSEQCMEQLHQGDIEKNWKQIGVRIKETVEFLYDNIELTRLLITNAEIPGVKKLWLDFIHEHTRLTYEYTNQARAESIVIKDIKEENMEMLIQSYAMAILEPIRKGYSKKAALEYLDLVDSFFDWKGLLLK